MRIFFIIFSIIFVLSFISVVYIVIRYEINGSSELSVVGGI